MDVKEREGPPGNVPALAVRDGPEQNPLVKEIGELFLQGDGAEGAQRLLQRGVAVDGQRPLVAAFAHGGGGHAHQPHGPQQVVGVGVGQKPGRYMAAALFDLLF